MSSYVLEYYNSGFEKWEVSASNGQTPQTSAAEAWAFADEKASNTGMPYRIAQRVTTTEEVVRPAVWEVDHVYVYDMGAGYYPQEALTVTAVDKEGNALARQVGELGVFGINAEDRKHYGEVADNE